MTVIENAYIRGTLAGMGGGGPADLSADARDALLGMYRRHIRADVSLIDGCMEYEAAVGRFRTEEPEPAGDAAEVILDTEQG